MLEAGFFRHPGIPGNGLRLFGDPPAVADLAHFPALFPKNGNLVVLEKDDPAGVGEQGRDIGGEEGAFPVLQPQDQRTVTSGGDDGVRLPFPENADGEGPLHLFEGLPGCLDDIVSEMFLDQVGQDLGVGFGTEDVPFFLQCFLQGPVIFDDAVVD